MDKQFTVILCTHNPRKEYLDEVILALGAQTLPIAQWHLVLVDNASNPPLDSGLIDSRNFDGLLVHEGRAGKVNAMIAAAEHVRGEWVVFVDDDNVLEPNYLEQLSQLDRQFPRVGVMSGSIEGRFESPVPGWAVPYLSYLAIRPLDRSYWANIVGANVGPIGAGMCVRRQVYDQFLKSFRSGEVEVGLGRTAGSLTAGTDDTIFMDLAFPLGLGCGAFPELKMTHLISKGRLEFEYIIRLVRDISRSHALLEIKRQPENLRRRMLGVIREALSAVIHKRGEARRVLLARCQGRWEAYRSAL